MTDISESGARLGAYGSSLFSQIRSGYAALAGPQGQPQSATDTIDKLNDRLSNSEYAEDRKAALLGVKGLSRDWKGEVGSIVMPTLLTLLERDAAADPELAKTVLETINVLCEVEETQSGRPSKDPSPGLRNTDRFLAAASPLHALLKLLGQQHFYVRYFSLQLLGTLLSSRPDPVQLHVLSAPGGLSNLVEVLDDKRDIVRNESLLLLISLSQNNADIQKIVAFEGAFDKLFRIVDAEGGISSGGIVVQDSLSCIVGLLRYNVSNQNYFRETSCIPMLGPLLLFPPPAVLEQDPPTSQHAIAAFANQAWDEQKATNADLVLSIIRMLVGGAGEGRAIHQKALLAAGLTRCLLELALASSAPPQLKAQCLHAAADIFRTSPPNQDLLTSLQVSPMIPTPPSAENNYDGADYQRADPVPAILALIALAVQGDPGLGVHALGPQGLRARAGAVHLLEAYLQNNPDAQVSLASSMTPPATTPPAQTAGTVLLAGLRTLTSSNSHGPLLCSFILAHLLRNTESCKRLCRDITFDSAGNPGTAMSTEEDERVGLINVIIGNLMMAQREAGEGGSLELQTEWARVQVGYLLLLSVWLFESPRSVREFLSEGSNLQVLIQPITQASGVDPVVQGLCAFLLSVVYEYNREPAKEGITRATLHPILTSRVGPDQFVARIARLREDDRFKDAGPNILEFPDLEFNEVPGANDGLWFDWPFVEFLRNNYLSVQRAVLLEPGQADASRLTLDSAETLELLAGLRGTISKQAKDLEEMHQRLREVEEMRQKERSTHQIEVVALQRRLQEADDASRTAAAQHQTELDNLRADYREADEARQKEPRVAPANLDAITRHQNDAGLGQTAELQASRAEQAALNEQVLKLRAEVEAVEARRLEGEREQEDLLMLLEDLGEKHKRDKAKLKDLGQEISEDEADGDDDIE